MELNNSEFELVEFEPTTEKRELSWLQHIILFFVGFFLLSVLASIVGKFLKPIGAGGNTALMATLLSFIVYLLMFTILSIILYFFKILKPLYIDFITLKPYLKGVFYGFIVIIASVSYSSFVRLIMGPQDSNQNQQAIENVLINYPILNFVWIVICGPLVEEYIYRIGLFGGLRKVNRILAYVVSGIVFGFIHFTIPYTDGGIVDTQMLIIEFVNIPSYIISGLLFAYIYEKEGFATSGLAHITNNFVSFIVTIIAHYVQT